MLNEIVTEGFFFKENKEGVDDEKVITHANRLDVYMDEKIFLSKGRYSLKELVFDGKKVI